MCAIPATAMAEEAGFKKLANIILAGKLFAETRFCEEETLWKAIEKCVPAKKAAMLDMNKTSPATGNRRMIVPTACRPSELLDAATRS